MKTIFIVDKNQEMFYIQYNPTTFKDLPFNFPTGSYNVLKARLFNTTYMNFLRIARNNYGAKLHGTTGYMIEVFDKKENAEKLCSELNKRINKVLEQWEEYNKSLTS